MPNHEENKKSPGGSDKDRLEKVERTESDFERRLASVEDSTAKLRDSQLENHKWYITLLFTVTTLIMTLIFGGVGVFLAYTANQSREDLRGDLQDMRNQVQGSVADMQAQVANQLTK